ncbi:MAG: response regulator, partial [Alphaproteobacteria bacterium]|nr:response regulator [Alphaproteobacteria bacterium]
MFLLVTNACWLAVQIRLYDNPIMRVEAALLAICVLLFAALRHHMSRVSYALGVAPPVGTLIWIAVDWSDPIAFNHYALAMLLFVAAVLTVTSRQQATDRSLTQAMRDLTRQNAALAQATEDARAASRAKTDFLANMSHEVRTPLNGVIGIIDALSRTQLSPEQAEMVGLVRDSGVVLERLVSDFLVVSKIEAGQLDLESRAFDLEEALRPSIEATRLRAQEKGLALHVTREEGALGRYMGDATRISQIVGNLLSNAVKFTESGHIALRIGRVDGPGGDHLTLVVEDTGVGFDADAASRLFDRFRQADETISRRFGGTGLGLSICRSLADLMGGEISATSEPGRGSRFVVSIPLPRAEPASTDDSSPGAEVGIGARMRPLRILLAEDHPTNQRVVQLILASQDAELVTVEDGRQAVAAFAGGGFDIVLMDMQMPHMDGLAATRAIRAWEAEHDLAPTPIVMLSANAMAEHQQEAMLAGANLHVAKPITAASLLAGIGAALAA